MTKCIYTVLKGGFWVSRAMVADFVHLLREYRTTTVERATTPNGKAGAWWGLSAREAKILGAVVERRTIPDIAAAFGIDEQAVKQHLTDIYDKLGVYENLELVLFGWIDQQLA